MSGAGPADPHDPGVERAAERAGEVADAASVAIGTAGDHAIRIGTASWTDPTMTAAGAFYPTGAASAEDRLHFYATTFPVVEVDATYYALPVPRTAELWVERTPPDFVFDVKAHALMTGQPTETRRLPKAIRDELPAAARAKARLYPKDLPGELRDAVWATFREGLAPLDQSGQLGSILLQYPRWVFPSNEARAMIEDAAERLAGLRCSVEFRHGSWLNEKNAERTLRFLRDRGLAFVMVDEPQGFRSSVPAVTAVTSEALAIVRFHGRNAATWEAQGITPAERFRYLYDRQELGEWVPRIRQASAEAADTHVLMNNCYANYGTTNAREMAALLGAVEPDDG